MSATRRGRALRTAAFLIVGGLALSLVETTAAGSNGDRKLADPNVHMHGQTPHDHGADATAIDGKLSKVQRLRRKARGLNLNGLRRADRKHQCRTGYVITTDGRKDACTHGPDAAPEGVDVRVVPSTAELAEAAEIHGADAGASALPCYGDGVTGPRVQAVYAHASDVANRFGEVAELIPQWAARVDAVFSQSARETGGERHVRFVTNPDCTLNVLSVQLSPTGDDSLTNTINELRGMGFTRTDRKYLIWADASRYCGIGEVLNDDRPDAGNTNNYGPSFARVDASCWGKHDSVEAHELMHNLGGIQLSAPHSSGGWHCVDENDRMCLAETSAVSLTFPCDSLHEAVFDCGHDDYYSTAPSAGSYLATHWNTANSSFLSAVMPEGCWSSSPTTRVEPVESKRKKHRRHRRARARDVAGSCIPAVAFAP